LRSSSGWWSRSSSRRPSTRTVRTRPLCVGS
jgi:hypothetical protein